MGGMEIHATNDFAAPVPVVFAMLTDAVFLRAVCLATDPIEHDVSVDGLLLSDAEWHANVLDWLPTDDDKAHVKSLQVGVTEPGKMAGWVAPPSTGIHQQPVDFEYVKL